MTSTTPLPPADLTRCDDCGGLHWRLPARGSVWRPTCARHCDRRGDDPLEPCLRWRLTGQAVCRKHGGGSPQARAAAKQRLQSQAVEGQIGALLAELELDAADVHPVEVILDAVRRAWAMVQVLGALVGEVDRGGLWGPDHLGDARPHVATEMYRTWLADAGRLSKLALDAGVDERRVRLAESQGEQLAGVVRGILGGLLELLLAAGLDGGLVRSVWEERLPGLVRAELAAVVGGVSPAGEGEG